jgi:pyridoxine 5-phosphate synthase
MTSKTAKTARGGLSVAPIRLGINIDHIATLRNARGGRHPDPLRAAKLAVEAGADNITAHLREDRRHIRDDDIARLAANLSVPLNMEMAATPEMLAIALKTRPHAACLVPEKRTERTTEGGLEAAGQHNLLCPVVAELADAGIRVSLFIAPEFRQIEAAARLRAPAIEIHVGPWCEALAEGNLQDAEAEWQRIRESARAAHDLGLEVHAGHGLDYATAATIASLPEIVELNIGHYLVGEAIFVGLTESVSRMRALMDGAREALRHSATEAEVGGT